LVSLRSAGVCVAGATTWRRGERRAMRGGKRVSVVARGARGGEKGQHLAIAPFAIFSNGARVSGADRDATGHER
jgi:hypothetical protein